MIERIKHLAQFTDASTNELLDNWKDQYISPIWEYMHNMKQISEEDQLSALIAHHRTFLEDSLPADHHLKSLLTQRR